MSSLGYWQIQLNRKQKLLLAGSSTIILLFLVLKFFVAPLYIYSYDTVRENFRPSDTIILDRNDRVIYRTRTNHQVRRLHWTSLEELSPMLKKAMIAAEDRRYYWHLGVDPISVITSMRDYVQSDLKRGASTISMQVASLLEGNKSPGRRSMKQKVVQAARAVLLEMAWSKSQILEAYFNLIPYRGELEGIGAASYGLFNKSPLLLSSKEASILAALVRAPNASQQRVSARACQILEEIDPNRACDGILEIIHAAVTNPSEIRMKDGNAYHATRFLLRSLRTRKQEDKFFRSAEASGIVKASLDFDLQRFVADSLKRHVEDNRSQNMNDGAVVVFDNKTGEVLAYVGNVGAESTARYVDGAQAKRQVGSTLKPFVFGLAFQEKYLSAASVLEDEPFEIAYATGTYKPANYDNKFRGPVTARVSLASSLNIPSVKAIQIVGVDRVVTLLHNLGMQGLREPEHYGPALALGSADLTLWELTNAYRSLANKGRVSEPVWFHGEERKFTQALSEEAVYIVSDILSDRASRSTTFGLENMLSTPFWTAVKTGTSKDMRDNWCIGYSEHYTVGVWTGNFSGKAMWNVSGVHGAAPVWMDVMSYLHQNTPSRAPKKPANVIRKKIFLSHLNRKVEDVFIPGTVPVQGATPTRSEEIQPTIARPKNGTIYAIDPDIPKDRHKISLAIDGWSPEIAAKLGLKLQINGKPLKLSNRGRVLWKAKRGTYRLALLTSEGKKLDTIRFYVK